MNTTDLLKLDDETLIALAKGMDNTLIQSMARVLEFSNRVLEERKRVYNGMTKEEK